MEDYKGQWLEDWLIARLLQESHHDFSIKSSVKQVVKGLQHCKKTQEK